MASLTKSKSKIMKSSIMPFEGGEIENVQSTNKFFDDLEKKIRD